MARYKIFFGNPTVAAGGISLSVDAGSYTLTGTAATLKHAWIVSAGVGSYSLSGTDASLLHKWVISAGAGSYALTGTSVSLNKGQRLTGDAGSYSLSGTDASFRTTRVLTADAGSYLLTGTAATLSTGDDDEVLSGTSGTIKKRRRMDDLYGPYRFREVARRLSEQTEQPINAERLAEAVQPKAGLTGTEYLESLGLSASRVDAEFEKLRAELREQELQIQDNEEALLLLLA